MKSGVILQTRLIFKRYSHQSHRRTIRSIQHQLLRLRRRRRHRHRQHMLDFRQRFRLLSDVGDSN